MQCKRQGVVYIFWPGVRYEVALASAGLSTLAARRDLLCTRFIANIVPDRPLYPVINSRLVDISAHHSLRSGSRYRLLPARTDRFSKFVTIEFMPGSIIIVRCSVLVSSALNL